MIIALEHPQAGDNQKATENPNYPVELRNQRCPCKNHHPTHYQRTQNTPKQDTVLIGGWHRKAPKQQHKNKDIIDAQ